MRRIVRALFFFIAGLTTVWAAGALALDVPLHVLGAALAALYVALFAVALSRRPGHKAIFSWIVSLLLILTWWLSLKPSKNRDWQPDVDRVSWAEVAGDLAVIHNIRDVRYVTEQNFTARWETRTVDIRAIRGVDLFLSHWGSPGIAHVMASFAFADGTYLTASVEARKATGESYSAIRAFFRQYEVIYLLAEERDVIGVRTNQRGECVYLYHTLTAPTDAQNLFRQYLLWMNRARFQPEWYNALTRNCLSDFVRYLANAKVGGVSRWDWRTLLDGSADQMLYDLGDLAGNLPFPELKKRALINSAAQRAGGSPDFSHAIREDRPGF